MGLIDTFLSLCNSVMLVASWRSDVRKTENLLKRCRHVGKGLEVGLPLFLSNPEKIEIGDYVHISSHTVIDGRGGLVIGNHTILSTHVSILTSDHQYDGGESIPFGTSYIDRPVHIGDCAWIGMHVCIRPGVKIGKGAIIGMGAVVTKEIPEYAIAAGNPAKVLKVRDVATFQRLEEKGRFFVKARAQDELWKFSKG